MYTQRFDLAHLEVSADDYRGATAYARAKRAQVVLAHEWARRWGPDGVASYAMHPGWVATPGLATGLPRFARLGPLLRTPNQGADTVTWLASDGPRHDGAPEPRPGGIWLDRRRRPEYYLPTTYRTPAQRRARRRSPLAMVRPPSAGRGATPNAMTSRAVVWFRRDLRLEDNPAWAAATSQGRSRHRPLRPRPRAVAGFRGIPSDTADGASPRTRREPATGRRTPPRALWRTHQAGSCDRRRPSGPNSCAATPM